MSAHPMFGRPRPAWFWGPADKLALLRRAAGEREVVLDPVTPPGEDEAQELIDELADIIVAEGLDEQWSLTEFGDLAESLISGLHRYAYPDEH
ncbi:hypothetical protein [Kitasatospora sp. P5_F3]